MKYHLDTNTSLPQSAIIIGNYAHFGRLGGIDIFERSPNGLCGLIAIGSWCAGCINDHYEGGCSSWSILCNICGGTGWECYEELGQLEFFPGESLQSDLPVCGEVPSPRQAFLRLLETDLSILRCLHTDKPNTITQALVRGVSAKIEICTLKTRYMALMQKDSDAWCLAAFAQICQVCLGHGFVHDDRDRLCPSCGGLKWGKPGELRYGFNNAPEWYTFQD